MVPQENFCFYKNFLIALSKSRLFSWLKVQNGQKSLGRNCRILVSLKVDSSNTLLYKKIRPQDAASYSGKSLDYDTSEMGMILFNGPSCVS